MRHTRSRGNIEPAHGGASSHRTITDATPQPQADVPLLSEDLSRNILTRGNDTSLATPDQMVEPETNMAYVVRGFSDTESDSSLTDADALSIMSSTADPEALTLSPGESVAVTSSEEENEEREMLSEIDQNLT